MFERSVGTSPPVIAGDTVVPARVLVDFGPAVIELAPAEAETLAAALTAGAEHARDLDARVGPHLEGALEAARTLRASP